MERNLFAGIKPGLVITGLIACVLSLAAFDASGADRSVPTPGARDLWTCGQEAFPFKALSRPTGYERRNTKLAAAIGRTLKRYPGLYPRRGWRLTYHDRRRAELTRGRLGGPYIGVLFFRKTESGWQWDGSGDCSLAPFRRGAHAGTWRLSRGEEPTGDSASFKVDVDGLQCSGGMPPGKRIMAPEIEYGEGAIVVTYFVKNLKGIHTCQGSPPSTIELQLDQALGGRRVLDGSTYPYLQQIKAPQAGAR